jgi:hypothetical protein
MGDFFGGNTATILISTLFVFYVVVVIIKLRNRSIKCTYCRRCNIEDNDFCTKKINYDLVNMKENASILKKQN